MWVCSLSKSFESHRFTIESFPNFTINGDVPAEKLYVRENGGHVTLISFDGGYELHVKSTEELPFDKIANRLDLFFEKVNNVWILATYDPRVKVSH